MSDNPYQASGDLLQAVPPKPPRSLGSRFIELGVVVVILLVLAALLVPATRRGASGAARRMQCSNNFKQISLALLSYESAYGVLPPAFTTDERGQRLHSWRTLLLPYLEQQLLYDQIDLSKPWNDPANAFAMQAVPHMFCCPELPGNERTNTAYFAAYGPEACFLETDYRPLSDITDSPSETLAIWEGNAQQAIHWFSPLDPPAELFIGLPSSVHTGGSNGALIDGSVRFFPDSLEAEYRRNLVSIADGVAGDQADGIHTGQ